MKYFTISEKTLLVANLILSSYLYWYLLEKIPDNSSHILGYSLGTILGIIFSMASIFSNEPNEIEVKIHKVIFISSCIVHLLSLSGMLWFIDQPSSLQTLSIIPIGIHLLIYGNQINRLPWDSAFAFRGISVYADDEYVGKKTLRFLARLSIVTGLTLIVFSFVPLKGFLFVVIFSMINFSKMIISFWYAKIVFRKKYGAD
ncbi:hypothetical protein [Flectobacillus longus]|uniref:hypothetical protein n=1 Tax=Flectobacillus longus TaxID=2984207 RepID=UPI0024B75532|nr:hypothetical protein [Flectobacillus longus]MDI9882526.1 hypothetical protein [Flectobacillus longus]